ncbi:MAG: hypothetical protein A4E57_03125 [Syntrophorhabdaceae bacterium PtaU1.Bin034]|jgi:hypothetical protein|nr:MAG: hypothetical protein A4E57_03125 [Syntrophorhabdaceae bacterium PtaU1.Bin034]
MKVLNLKVKSNGEFRDIAFPVRRMVNAGYTARDQEGVRKHIEELKEKGVPAPAEIPTLYPVASYLIETGGTLEVVEEDNSGEAEFVLLIEGGRMYVGVGSDHTDRALEATSIVKAKQLCPNVMSPVVWPYEELKDIWNGLVLRSWVERNGQRTLYQEDTLSAFITVEDLLSFVRGRIRDGNLENTVIFSGTVPVLGGTVLSGNGFDVELFNPANGDSLWCRYRIEMLAYI